MHVQLVSQSRTNGLFLTCTAAEGVPHHVVNTGDPVRKTWTSIELWPFQPFNSPLQDTNLDAFHKSFKTLCGINSKLG